MANIRIVTDSTADIPADIRQKLNIEIIPLKVHFGEQSFLDAVTIGPEEFYDRLKSASKLPTTSQPSPSEFAEAYKRILNADADAQIISIHLASALSGTYQSALLAKTLLNGMEEKITVVDSHSACYGFGLLVVAAAEAAKEGETKEDILALISSLREETVLYFLVDTLEYLQKGGRIGKAAALFGTLLQIKPILTLDQDGVVMAVDKVRGQKKAMMRIVRLMQQHYAPDDPVKAVVAHANARDTAEAFAGLLQEHFTIDQLLYTSIGSVIGTHAGPGTVAVFAVRG